MTKRQQRSLHGQKRVFYKRCDFSLTGYLAVFSFGDFFIKILFPAVAVNYPVGSPIFNPQETQATGYYYKGCMELW